MSLQLTSALCLLAILGDFSFSTIVQQQIDQNLTAPASRIHSGMLTRKGDLPFVMKILGTKLTPFRRTTNICTSSLIHPRWLLTAAHCKLDQFTYKVFLDSPPETREKEFAVADADWILHPLFNADPDDQNFTSDLALIHLANWNINWVTPVTIANFSSDPWTFLKTTQGAMVTPAGYGKIDQSGIYSNQVRKTFMYPEPQCPYLYCPAFCSPYSGDREPMFCVRGGPAMEGICAGDSGGPILFEDAESKIAFGIISSGIAKACSVDDPDRGPWNEVHWAVRISWHLDWIKEKMCEKGDRISYMDYQCP